MASSANSPQPTTTNSFLSRGQRLYERLQQGFAFTVWNRLLDVEFFDRSIALAGKAFVSFFPLIIVVTAFLPTHLRNAVLSTMVHRLGITGPSQASVSDAFANSSQVRSATSILGLLLTIIYASSFTTALRRMYVRVWRRRSGRAVRAYLYGSMWVAGCIAYMALVGGLRTWLGNGVIPISIFVVLSVFGSALFWTTTAWLCLEREVKFTVLVATGTITGALTLAYAFTAQFWMPSQITSNELQFGFFGIALSFVTWLSGISICLLIGAAAGVVVVEADGLLGRIARLGTEHVLTPTAQPFRVEI